MGWLAAVSHCSLVLNFPTTCEVMPTGTTALVAGDSIAITMMSAYIAGLPDPLDQPERHYAGAFPQPGLRVMRIETRGSVSAEHQDLERKHQRLQPQDQRMHQRERVHDVERDAPHGAGFRIRDY